MACVFPQALVLSEHIAFQEHNHLRWLHFVFWIYDEIETSNFVFIFHYLNKLLCYWRQQCYFISNIYMSKILTEIGTFAELLKVGSYSESSTYL